MKLPVFKAFSAGLALLFANAGELIKGLWLPTLLLVGAMAYVMPGYMELSLEMSRSEAEGDPAIMFEHMGPMIRQMGLLYLVMAIAYPMMIAGNLKYIIRGQTPKLPFYLQYGLDEFRILITYILFVIMFILAVAAFFLAIAVLGVLSTVTSQAVGGLLVLIIGFVGGIALLWFVLRLSMMFPATIAERLIGLSHSWRITKGNAWRLLFYWILWGVVLTVVGFVYMAIAYSDFIGLFFEMALAAAEDPDAAAEFEMKMLEMQAAMWNPKAPGFWLFIGASYMFQLVYWAMLNVASGVAYRYLSNSEANA